MYSDVGGKLLTGRIAEAADIAEAFLYLLHGDYTTGQIVELMAAGCWCNII